MSKFIKNKIKKLAEKMSKENAIKIAKEYEVLQSINSTRGFERVGFTIIPIMSKKEKMK